MVDRWQQIHSPVFNYWQTLISDMNMTDLSSGGVAIVQRREVCNVYDEYYINQSSGLYTRNCRWGSMLIPDLAISCQTQEEKHIVTSTCSLDHDERASWEGLWIVSQFVHSLIWKYQILNLQSYGLYFYSTWGPCLDSGLQWEPGLCSRKRQGEGLQQMHCIWYAQRRKGSSEFIKAWAHRFIPPPNRDVIMANVAQWI